MEELLFLNATFVKNKTYLTQDLERNPTTDIGQHS